MEEGNEIFFLKSLFLIVVLSGVMIFSACDGAGTTATEDTTTDDSIKLAGTVGDENVSMSLDFASSGVSRAAADEVAITGFLVYGDITLNCSGTYDTATGVFYVSATGSFGDMKLVFSLTGTIVDGAVTSASIMLTVYDGEDVTGSYSASLTETTDTVEETSSVCTDNSESYDFEGTWTLGDVVLNLTDSSFTFIDEDETTNCTIRKIEVSDSNSSDYNMVYVMDNDLLEGDGAAYGIALYLVSYLKIRISSDGNTLTIVDPGTIIDVQPYYILTNVNFEDLNNDTLTEYSAYQIASVTFSGEALTSYNTDISLTTLIGYAEAIDLDDSSTTAYPFTK